MTDTVKISELEEATSANKNDIMTIVQNSENKKMFLSVLRDLFFPVGTYYASPVNPSSTIGGTWKAVNNFGYMGNDYETINVYASDNVKQLDDGTYQIFMTDINKLGYTKSFSYVSTGMYGFIIFERKA